MREIIPLLPADTLLQYATLETGFFLENPVS
jgi:hypothetical protein